MKIALWDDGELVNEMTLTEEQHDELAVTSVVQYDFVYYLYQGLFNGAINFTKCAPPLPVGRWFGKED